MVVTRMGSHLKGTRRHSTHRTSQALIQIIIRTIPIIPITHMARLRLRHLGPRPMIRMLCLRLLRPIRHQVRRILMVRHRPTLIPIPITFRGERRIRGILIPTLTTRRRPIPTRITCLKRIRTRIREVFPLRVIRWHRLPLLALRVARWY